MTIERLKRCPQCTPSEHLEILGALPVGDVAAEALQLMTLHREIALQELRPQHLAEYRIGPEVGQRLLEAAWQLHMRRIILARPLRLGLQLELVLDPQQTGGQ